MSDICNCNEKAYKSMGLVGVLNIVVGIVIISISAITGAFVIIAGAKLIKDKAGITF